MAHLFPRKDFYFIRHGETDINAQSHVKRTDYDLPLNDRGIEQAIAARQICSKLPIKIVRSSPIQRAIQTRDILLETLSVTHLEDERLSECLAQVWTNMVLLEENPNHPIDHTVQQFLLRTKMGIEAALENEGPTLIVAHGGVHWAICYHLMIQNHPWKIGNCQIVHFQPMKDMQWKAVIL